MVNDTQESRNVDVPPQHLPLRLHIKQLRRVATVCATLNLEISVREEVGCHDCSEIIATHYSSVEEVLKTWSTY